MKPEDFILTTDYTTIKNDGEESFTITIPGNSTIGAGVSRQWTQTKVVGTQGGFDLLQLSYTGQSVRYAGPITSVSRNGTAPGWGTVSYDIRLQVSRTSPTEITAVAEIFNFTSATLTTNSSAITFTFYVTTLRPPFA